MSGVQQCPLSEGQKCRYYAAPASRTISKRYLLSYQDGSRKHITRAERDSLILSRQARRTESGNYFFIGPIKSIHVFADLEKLIDCTILPPAVLRHYLDALCVVFELALERERQLEETPEAFAIRLEQMGCVWREAGAVMQAL